MSRLGRPSASHPGVVGSLCPVPLPPSVCVGVRCPGPLGACSPVRALRFACAVSVATWRLLPSCALCAAYVCCWWLRSGSPPLFVFLTVFFLRPFVWCPRSFMFALRFFLMLFCVGLSPLFCFFGKNKMEKGRVYTAGTGLGNWRRGAAVLCSLSWCASLVLCWRSRPSGAALAS